MATILDGKALAEQCKQEVKKAAETLARRPGLAVIIVGNNPASRVYVNSKRKDCEECGFFSEEYALPEETTQGELIALIEQRTSGRKSTVSSASFRCPRELTKRQFSWPSLQRKTWMAFIR